jgi:fucose permease
LKETKGLPIVLAGVSLSLFFACLAAGRLSSSYLITKFREPVYLLGLFSLLFVALLISVVVPGKWAILFFALCGFAHSGVFPCLLGMGGKLYSKNPGTPLGMIATGAGLGSTFLPWLMSLVAEVSSLHVGFLFYEVFVISNLTLTALNLKNWGSDRPFYRNLSMNS